MKILIDAIFLFIFIVILFYFKFPNIESQNYIKHKLILFPLIVIFYYILSICRKIGNKYCSINHYIVISNSIKISLAGIVGYSLYYDFLSSDMLHEYLTSENEYKKIGIVSLIIVGFIVILQCFESIFYNSENIECINDKKK